MGDENGSQLLRFSGNYPLPPINFGGHHDINGSGTNGFSHSIHSTNVLTRENSALDIDVEGNKRKEVRFVLHNSHPPVIFAVIKFRTTEAAPVV